jgi:hypothetical protein
MQFCLGAAMRFWSELRTNKMPRKWMEIARAYAANETKDETTSCGPKIRIALGGTVPPSHSMRNQVGLEAQSEGAEPISVAHLFCLTCKEAQ